MQSLPAKNRMKTMVLRNDCGGSASIADKDCVLLLSCACASLLETSHKNMENEEREWGAVSD